MGKITDWVPLDQRLSAYLPKDRPYTRLEAMFSRQLDLYNETGFSIRGYAKLWQWSRKKVANFLNNSKEPLGSHQRATWEPPVELVILDLQKQKSHLGATKEPLGSRTIIEKRKSKRKNKDIAPKKARMNGIWEKSTEPMDSEIFIALLRRDKKRYINLIAEYADEQKMDFQTKGQWHEFITRNVRYATKLSVFDDTQLSDAMKQVKSASYLEKYTLETLHKFLVK